MRPATIGEVGHTDPPWLGHPGELPEALLALPAGAWRYGRVVAIAESPLADRKKRASVRRNVEAAIQQLNDLGVVVEEWPSR